MGVPDRAPREPSMAENVMFLGGGQLSSMLDQRMGRAAATDDLSYNELGNVDPDLSVVAELPPDAPSRPTPTPSANDAFGAGKTVLIVDDEIDIRRLLRRVWSKRIKISLKPCEW
ncbi:MAG: hypothetical protein U0165_02390 [Polyangiaceae bacterium]